jgi:aromatic ring hydroxylase
MFENMATFQKPQNKKYIGNGAMLFGKYDRVTPYSEVKDAMVKIIQAEIHQ